MIPLLTLGIPGGGTTAVLSGVLIMHGIQPGPNLFEKHPDLVWGLIASMYVGNVMLLILNLPLVGVFVRMLYIPAGLLFPLIIVISAIGAFALNSSTTDLYLILFFGVLGYLFEKVDIPIAPLVLSLVLGGMMEQSFRQAMTVSGGNPSIFLHSTVARVLIALSLMALLVPLIARLFRSAPR